MGLSCDLNVAADTGVRHGRWYTTQFRMGSQPGTGYCRLPGFCQGTGWDYDYDDPAWEGEENYCSVYVDDEDAIYLFVVRAFDEDGFESDDSNEVIYDGDGEYTNEDDSVNESRYVDGGSSSSGSGCFIGSLR